MNKEKKMTYLEYKNSKKIIILMVAIYAIILVISFVYINSIRGFVYKNIYKNLEEFSEQTAAQLIVTLNDQKSIINLMSQYANRGYIENSEELFESFSDELGSYHFTRLAIVDENGNGITSDGYEINNYEHVAKLFETDQIQIIPNIPSLIIKDKMINIYSKICYIDGNKFALVGTIDSENYQEILLKKLFGKGGTYLITSDGTVLIDSFNNIQDSTTNLYRYFKTRYSVTAESEIEKIDKMESQVLNGDEGIFGIDFIDENDGQTEKEIYFVHFKKIGVNDWYIVTTASDSTIAYELMSLIGLATIITLLIAAGVITVSIIAILYMQKRNRMTFEIAYKDAVTELGNDRFFKHNANVFLNNEQINNKYIITTDINKFKALNTIYGYAFCNKILKKLGKNLHEYLPCDNITCRLSNDVFATIFSYSGNVEKLLKKVCDKSSNMIIDEVNIQLNLSMGAYKILPSDNDIAKILDKSFLARSQIKGNYFNEIYIFDDTLENQMMETQILESGMKKRNYK